MYFRHRHPWSDCPGGDLILDMHCLLLRWHFQQIVKALALHVVYSGLREENEECFKLEYRPISSPG